MKTFQEILVTLAVADIGLRERAQHDNRGSQIQKFFDADNLDLNGSAPGDDGYAWCAAAMDLWVQEAIVEWEKQHGRKVTFAPPRTAAAFGFEAWSLAQDASTLTRFKDRNPRIGGDVKRGDICILSISHICLATHDAANGGFRSVDGNSNDEGSREGYEVCARKRTISSLRSVIRFNVD